ncbi:MAG: hypothetical protein GY720_12940 [bacterium]|nr:hypothetical protein [bacterium]
MTEGGDGADRIRAKGGADNVFSGDGDDRLRGNGGPHFLDGGPESDWFLGGSAADTCANGQTVISCIQ